MKGNISRLLLLLGDILGIFISLCLAYGLRVFLDDSFDLRMKDELWMYASNIFVYVLIIIVFFGEKIYTDRYDFWEETSFVIKGIFISLALVLSILALSKSMQDYSRFIFVIAFLCMLFVLPMIKNILKKLLFNIGLWKRSAYITGNDSYIKEELFGNPYLGYVDSDEMHANTIFIDTEDISVDELQTHLDSFLRENKEVLFLPLLQSYNFSNVRIIELFNARKNLVVLENSLLKKSNIWIKKMSDVLLSLLIFPFVLLLFVVIVFFMKKEEPNGKILFKQKRIGKNGKEFTCYKFRSMREDGDKVLKAYLQEHPDEIVYYDKYHKYKNDPRITKVGRILRRTSLDEIPQIINVLKGEMSLIGPRPYMFNEKEKIGAHIGMVLAVKPGITGLWQVSGRSEVDFDSRVDMDIWYTRNWNLWLDLVVLIKTIKVVLFRNGAH